MAAAFDDGFVSRQKPDDLYDDVVESCQEHDVITHFSAAIGTTMKRAHHSSSDKKVVE